MQDRPTRSVSFGYSQDNVNQWPTNGNYYIFLEAKWRFAWVMSLITRVMVEVMVRFWFVMFTVLRITSWVIRRTVLHNVLYNISQYY